MESCLMHVNILVNETLGVFYMLQLQLFSITDHGSVDDILNKSR